jgi:hypothetical protein
MATSPAHKFGQEIGILPEEIVKPMLGQFASEHGYYLDSKGSRGKARSGKKVTWADKYGNNHDLDFVIEKGGTADVRGHPLAFIETAWRRYTKHARNKAQEIQGAILPIAEKHSWDAPFLGVIIAGVFTEGAIAQMKSSGFHVLYISRDTIIAAFAAVGISIEFDETTPDREFKKCLRAFAGLPLKEREKLKETLRAQNSAGINLFMSELASTLSRHVETILVTPLFGTAQEFDAPEKALQYLNNALVPASKTLLPLNKIDILIRYSNGDTIQASFRQREMACNFIKHLTA